MTAVAPLLEVRNLSTTFGQGNVVRAVNDATFSIAPGEVLGLIGESGSGKTVTGLSLLRLLPEHAEVSAAGILFRSRDLTKLSDEEFRALRGIEMAMIFQDPVGSFNPAKTIGWHLKQAIQRQSEDAPSTDAPSTDDDWRKVATKLLNEVGIRAADRVLGSYAHQLSGGMLQRALIAIVIALAPALIIADEPTTNLDNLVERQILDLIRRQQRRLGASVLFITHDLAIAQELCDRVAVMYAGEIVELGPTEEVLRRPRHPYSAGLLATSLSLESRSEYLYELPGEPGGKLSGTGCAFAARCPSVMTSCIDVHPNLIDVGPDHKARCLLNGN